jgi:hypothetical protein
MDSGGHCLYKHSYHDVLLLVPNSALDEIIIEACHSFYSSVSTPLTHAHQSDASPARKGMRSSISDLCNNRGSRVALS